MSFDIAKVDVNFAVDVSIDKKGLVFYSPDSAPFRLYGVKRDGDEYWRLPRDIAKSVSDGVYTLGRHTAGGRIRFVSNTGRIAVCVQLVNSGHMPHMPMTGSSGVDIYVDGRYGCTAKPPVMMQNCAYEQFIYTDNDKDFHLFEINLPLYNGVKNIYVGLDDWAEVRPAPDYAIEKPIVFYGSSITQGGCASRPGNSYEAMISRALDANYINLGFSGNAKAEQTIANYIANLEMSCFVYDYDHNAHSLEYLSETHHRMYKIIREKNPDLPILMVSAPKDYLNSLFTNRRQIIMQSYLDARAAGDNKVFFVDGARFFDDIGDSATVDGTHPNDLGFFCMARGILRAIKQALV